MVFLVTNSTKIKDDVLVNGYFTAENKKESIELENVKQVIREANTGNKHFNANDTKVYFHEVQMALVKSNLKLISKEYGWDIKVRPAKDFQGDLGSLKDAVLSKD